jgi:NAD(P)-dependent dehydrogenase (short-subunit alcohol dehydrogenase family)
MAETAVGVVVGAGPGLGNALVNRFADGGMAVAAVSRRGIAPELRQRGGVVRGYACDATVTDQVKSMFARVNSELGPPELVVFNVGTWDRAGILEISDDLFVQAWRTGCFGGFVVGRAAAEAMLPQGRGTIMFTGATGSLRGGAGFAAFAVPKFGLRALAQSMARELGPKGIHVAHVIVDGMIAPPGGSPQQGFMKPDEIAEAYFQLHRQQRSAWTHEVDLRPSIEKF